MAGNYQLAKNYYLGEYKSHPDDVFIQVKIASCYALLNKNDSAFYFLSNVITDKKFEEHILHHYNFENLKTDVRWNDIESRLDELYLKNNPGIKNRDLASQLRRMGVEDQKYRSNMTALINPSKMSHAGWDSIYKLQGRIDSANLRDLESMIEKNGWPLYRDVGKQAAGVAVWIILHADLKIMKKYYPLLKSASEKNEASRESFATLHDRILIDEGKRQYYGTQYRYNEETGEGELYPIEDMKNVDKRRKKLGLHPILKPYVNEFGGYVMPPKIGK